MREVDSRGLIGEHDQSRTVDAGVTGAAQTYGVPRYFMASLIAMFARESGGDS